jgi:serine/threonine-protein kinase
MIGRTLSHYRVEELLGSGTMGVVYRAVDEQGGRDVAIKLLPEGLVSDENARGRLAREARALSKLAHPNIEDLYAFETSENDVDFLVMELLEGQTLRRRLETGEPFEEDEVIDLGLQLLSAVEAAHAQGIAHRDLKPANIAIAKDGTLKVLDFGLAKWFTQEVGATTADLSSSTDTSVSVGTVPYMSPEQLRGNVDERCDLFGAGAVLYEMLTGVLAFPQKHPADLIQAILSESPPTPLTRRPGISHPMSALVMKALEKRPDDRFRSARDMRRSLERVRTGEPEPSGFRGLLRRIGIG